MSFADRSATTNRRLVSPLSFAFTIALALVAQQRTGDGFLCVYAITLPHSFSKIRDFYDHVRRVKDAENGFPLIILGNKCDLENDRKVTPEEGQALANELRCTFMETSAKIPKNVDEAFHTIVREMNKFREKHPPPADKLKKKTGCVVL